MQGNGFKIGVTLFFIGLCGYYLFPTFQNYLETSRLNDLDGEAREAYLEENYARIQRLKGNSLKLGLDLQGGMHVTMEVRTAALIGQLAQNTDGAFEEVLQAAREQAAAEGTSVIDAFVAAFEARDADARLSRYFRSEEDGITRRSTNDEVAAYLRAEADEAVDRAIEIVRNRVDRYGVTEPSIQKQGTRRIVVELPGIDDPDRIRDLLKGTARLEFRLMAEPQQLAQSMQRIIDVYEPAPEDTAATDGDATDATNGADRPDGEVGLLTEDEPDTSATAAATDTTAEADDGGTDDDGLDDDGGLFADDELEDEGPVNPLLEAMQPLPYGQSTVFGQVFESDTAAVNDLLADRRVQRLLPQGVELMYTSSPVGRGENGEEVYDILAVRSEVELSGDVITDARVEFDPSNRPEVSMTMDSEGARTWARITGANVGKQVAIVLDGVVYSYPNVNERITGGRSSISGLDSRQEAQDIVTVLKSGALPAPVEIIEERTVGPSLGAESIRAGFLSVAVGLLLVALFMIVYYRTAGIVADLALLLNVIFVLGVLAAFNATLTLPGIAGIVLTIGMAVDANVLIFERIREELTSGKTVKAATDTGYEKALSAILDANITTFFVGAILFSFGVGPIQGFAVTLMIGIVSSLFTAIVVTRIVIDYLLAERRQSVNYG